MSCRHVRQTRDVTSPRSDRSSVSSSPRRLTSFLPPNSPEWKQARPSLFCVPQKRPVCVSICVESESSGPPYFSLFCSKTLAFYGSDDPLLVFLFSPAAHIGSVARNVSAKVQSDISGRERGLLISGIKSMRFRDVPVEPEQTDQIFSATASRLTV